MLYLFLPLCGVVTLFQVLIPTADIARIRQNPVLRETAEFYDKNDVLCAADDAAVVRAEIALEAYAPGVILQEQKGHAGFGYDPLFYCPEAGCTFAQLTQEQKLSVSHRGRAIAALRALFDKASFL